jgi:hypothetical protein
MAQPLIPAKDNATPPRLTAVSHVVRLQVRSKKDRFACRIS